MKVYVLLESIPYESDEIIGIYSSLEKASGGKGTLRKSEVFPDEWYFDDSRYVIEEYEVE